MGDLTGKTVVVTGASSGIGRAAAIGFAGRGARLALVGRDPTRLAEALAAVRSAGGQATAHPADFAVLDQVRALAGELSRTYPDIDVLCNNAGGMITHRTTTVDGHELTMQANHLAPFLLTSLLRDRLAGGRVVNTSSDAHRMGAVDPADLDGAGTPYRAFGVYGRSKLANILFTQESARRWPDIVSTCYHPGVVRTRFGRDNRLLSAWYRLAFFLATPEQGADTMLWLASAEPAAVRSGGYYIKRKLHTPAVADDPVLAERLWVASESAVGLSTR